MRKIHCINAISKYGTDQFTEDYELTDEVNEAEGILVRSASLHEMQFSNSLLAIARAGAGVNNIPLDACAQEGIVVFNTPGANANGVKELVLAGLFLASLIKNQADEELLVSSRSSNKYRYQANRAFVIGRIKRILPKILCGILKLPSIDLLFQDSLRCRSQIVPGRSFHRKKNKTKGRTHFNNQKAAF